MRLRSLPAGPEAGRSTSREGPRRYLGRCARQASRSAAAGASTGAADVPLLRITCPSSHTEGIVEGLYESARATEVAVLPSASRVSGGDLILAEVPRSSIDGILDHLPDPATVEGLHVAGAGVRSAVPRVRRARPRPRPRPRASEHEHDDADAVVWAQVTQDVHEVGRLSWINVLLVVVAAAIAAVGIIEDELLLIVGAMALSPDYFPIADTCLSILRRDWRRTFEGLRTLLVSFTAGAVGAWLLTEALADLHIATQGGIDSRQLTLFISRPDALSVIVALLAGVAGALAITLPDRAGPGRGVRLDHHHPGRGQHRRGPRGTEPARDGRRRGAAGGQRDQPHPGRHPHARDPPPSPPLTSVPGRRSAVATAHRDAPVAQLDVFGHEAAGLLVLVAGHEPTRGVDHPPPRDLGAVLGQEPSDGPGPTREAGLGGDLAVGHHLAGPDRLEHPADGRRRAPSGRWRRSVRRRAQAGGEDGSASIVGTVVVVGGRLSG